MIRGTQLIVKIFLAAAACLMLTTSARAQTKDAQLLFDSPELAAKALVAAAKVNDQNALVEMFGAKYRKFIVTVDEASNRENRARFARMADNSLVMRREGDGRITLVVGYEAWPFPIPLARSGEKWRFDTNAGLEEMINRRIGENELATIEVMRRYGELQQQYASKPRDGTKVRQFAQKIASTPGKRDGLYWNADPAKNEEPSPVGPLIPDATTRKGGASYHGYYFKILTAQGAAAPAGRYSYVINGRMIAGFALVAFPADYGNTGIKTFIVNHYGVVQEKDLGPNSAKIAAAMTEYNPDSTWTGVKQ